MAYSLSVRVATIPIPAIPKNDKVPEMPTLLELGLMASREGRVAV
jgi:hypothetical protein